MKWFTAVKLSGVAVMLAFTLGLSSGVQAPAAAPTQYRSSVGVANLVVSALPDARRNPAPDARRSPDARRNPTPDARRTTLLLGAL